MIQQDSRYLLKEDIKCYLCRKLVLHVSVIDRMQKIGNVFCPACGAKKWQYDFGRNEIICLECSHNWPIRTQIEIWDGTYSPRFCTRAAKPT